MIKLDKVKFVTSIENVCDFKREKFLEVVRNDEILYYKYEQTDPYLLSIKIDYRHHELSIEFSGKILLDEYVHLINKHNIRDCLMRISELGLCCLNVNKIIQESNVVKCDVTQDVVYDNMTAIALYVKQNIKNHKKWVVKEYCGGITIENTAKTSKHKKRLIIYDKCKELKKNKNNEFLNLLSNRDSLENYYQDKIRFELNLKTMAQIRSLLCIGNNNI